MSKGKINFDKEAEEASESSEKEIGIDDLGPSGYIPSIKIGEEKVLKVKKMLKSKDTKGVDKNGNKFDSALSGVDFKYVLETEDGKRFDVTQWSLVHSLREVFKGNNKQKPTGKIRIKHAKDGREVEDRSEIWEVEYLGDLNEQ